jgi:hypothetical protein
MDHEQYKKTIQKIQRFFKKKERKKHQFHQEASALTKTNRSIDESPSAEILLATFFFFFF